ncbi:MAG: Transposase [Firmicutes bacterium ADurb.Bin182]|nr:MAG: Transposase [Firmicutes bacterium ADurb.Bin182]
MARMKKRDDGLYQRSITIGRNSDGKPLRKIIYGRTQKELEAKVAEYQEQLKYGMLPANENVTFGEMAKILCDDYKPMVSEGVRKRYVTTCEKHLKELNNIRLRDLKAAHLQSLINRLAQAGYATKSLSGIKQVASQVMRLAMDNDIVMRNVFERIKIPSIEAEKRTPLTEKQIELVNEHCLDHRMGLPVMLMLYAGLRRGELMALRWSHIDLENRVIHVREAWAFEATNVGHRKAPKTSSGKRDIPILDNLYSVLVRVKMDAKSSLVCPTAEGVEMTNIAWRRAWESYMHHLNIAAGGRVGSRSRPKITAIEPFTAHQLRHTFITLCHEAGIDVKVTQDMAGHADIRTTLGIYTHLTKVKKEEAVDTLNAHIAAKSKTKRDEMER